MTTYSVHHSLITKDLNAFIELYSEAVTHNDWNATVDTGFAYQLGENNQVDAGVNIGVTAKADPWNPFVGYSVRF